MDTSYNLDTFSNIWMNFIPCLICLNNSKEQKPPKKRAFVSKEDKTTISNNIPDSFRQIITGMLLSDGSLRMNGSMALLSIQQIHSELTMGLWTLCKDLQLVSSEILTLHRHNWQPVYSFQTLTLPFFTELFNEWYTNLDGRNIKILPNNIYDLFTPLAFAFLIMGDGSWDKSSSRIVLHLNNFTETEVNTIKSILLSKFNIDSYLVRTSNKNTLRGFIIKIPRREVEKVRDLTKQYIYPSLQYKLGL